MTTQEVLNQICNGKLKLNLCSHKPGYEGTLEYFKELLTLLENSANGLNDGEWGSNEGTSAEESNQNMRRFFQAKLAKPICEKHI